MFEIHEATLLDDDGALSARESDILGDFIHHEYWGGDPVRVRDSEPMT